MGDHGSSVSSSFPRGSGLACVRTRGDRQDDPGLFREEGPIRLLVGVPWHPGPSGPKSTSRPPSGVWSLGRNLAPAWLVVRLGKPRRL